MKNGVSLVATKSSSRGCLCNRRVTLGEASALASETGQQAGVGFHRDSFPTAMTLGIWVQGGRGLTPFLSQIKVTGLNPISSPTALGESPISS